MALRARVRRHWRFAICCTSILLASTDIAAQSLFTLDVDAASAGNPVVLTRPDNGVVPIRVMYSGTTDAAARAEASIFTSDQGSVTARLLADCSKPPASATPSVTLALKPNSSAPICLVVDPLPTAAKYTGRLIISSSGASPFAKAITLSKPVVSQGTLVVNPATISRTVSRSWRPDLAAAGAEVDCSVTLSEKSGAVRLQGLSARLEQITSSPDSGFDLNNNVQFSGISGLTITDGAQLAVDMKLRGLMPGDYVALLRFTAQNSGTDDGRLEIRIHVRDHPSWAVGWLIIALLISFIGTKVLTSQRRRANLLQQIRSLQPPWFAALPPIASVIWVRAVLHQARRLSERFWLTSPDQIEANVSGVRAMLVILDNVRQMRQKLDLALDWLTLRSAARALNRVVSRLEGTALDDAAIKSINADLEAFGGWLKDETFAATFWKNIEPSMQALQGEIGDGTIAAAAELFEALKTAVAAALKAPPTDKAGVLKVYRQYAQLRIFWQQRGDVAALVEPAKANDMDRFFELADQREWERIKTKTLSIKCPDATDPGGFEAYQALQFSVGIDDPAIERSYLFLHKIEYRWEFDLEPRATLMEKIGAKRTPAPIKLKPVSQGPSVVQYFPRPGKTRIAVDLVYRNDKFGPVTEGPEINRSSDFAAYKILAGTEITGWLIASIVAIATGLSTFYYKNASWGTFQDYLTLLLWGIGVDQGKNFLQAVQSYSTQSPPPAAGR